MVACAFKKVFQLNGFEDSTFNRIAPKKLDARSLETYNPGHKSDEWIPKYQISRKNLKFQTRINYKNIKSETLQSSLIYLAYI